MNNNKNTLFSSFRSGSKSSGTTQKKKKESVYIHCRAGHGRSAAVALAWLMYKNPMKTPKELNEYLSSKRNVRKYLWTQKNIIRFHSELPSLLSGDSGGDSDYEYFFDDSSSSYDGDDNDEESSIFSEDEDEKDYQLWKKYNG